MEGNKTYPKTKSYIFNTLYDIIELQNGEIIICDTIQGKLLYRVTMYRYIWQLLYSISEIGNSKCEVSISVIGERQDTKREIRRQFALLEAMLEGGADVKLTDTVQQQLAVKIELPNNKNKIKMKRSASK